MKKLIKEFFTNDAVLVICDAIAILFSVFAIAFKFYTEGFKGAYVECLTIAIVSILSLLTVASYIKHDKNVMKCTIGALLASFIFIFLKDGFDFTDVFAGVINVVIFVLVLALFATHIYINSDHHSSPLKVFFNQMVCIALAVVFVVDMVYSGIVDSNMIFTKLIYLLFYLSILLIVVIIESKLDAYRIKRESN